ncbi:MAG: hypothetical protein CMQ88_00645 [Gammaproteobacteria bacterium]|nr:hypothetical protein [Gammaproteobacteria bacterium]
MKNKIILAALLITSLSWGQDIFEKYEYDDSVTYFSISPKMFEMLAKLSVETNDADTGPFLALVQEIKSFKVISTESIDVAGDIKNWVDKHVRTSKMEELMRVRDEQAYVNFYIKSGKESDLVKELLMFVTDINTKQINMGDRKPETVLLYLSGDIDLTQISKLVNQMNLPGGQQLGKLNEK